ncbi:MAG TPA: flagellar biosynthesis protein FlhF, partial [Caldimonas sp.]
MNVKRFTARTSRDALALVRQALGDDAVVLSTRPSAQGVEVLAMAPESLRQVERNSGAEPRAAAASKLAARGERIEPALEESSALEDAERLTMSTLSFQDYVRDRMLKRRSAALNAQPRDAAPAEPHGDEAASPVAAFVPRAAEVPGDRAGVLEQRMAERAAPAARPLREPPVLVDPLAGEIHVPGFAEAGSARRNQEDMMNELRSMKGLIEERFGALAFMEKLQRQPGQARLTQKLLDCGFSPALIRKLADGLGP